MATLIAQQALLPTGWSDAVSLAIDADGMIAATAELDDEHTVEGDSVALAGAIIPGMPNAGSETALRAVAGRIAPFTLHHGALEPWRQAAWRLLDPLGPDEVEAIYALGYLEMVKAGFTSVAEAVTLPVSLAGDLSPWLDWADRVVAAAHRVGIGLTLLPSVSVPPGGARIDPDLVAQVFERVQSHLRVRHGEDESWRLGLGIRTPGRLDGDSLAALVATVQSADTMTPIHLMVGSDVRDATEFRSRHERRPIEWLVAETPIDGRWCLWHANQMTVEDAAALAETDAVVTLCPTFEAALGLPPFPFDAYTRAGGKLAIGSGAPLTVAAAEELRALAVRYRLPAQGWDGSALVVRALTDGAQALGRPVGQLSPNHRADLLVLDLDHPSLFGATARDLMDGFVFAGGSNPIRDVMIGGEWVVRGGHHVEEESILDAYRDAMDRLIG